VLDSIPGWSARRPALVRFRRSDFLAPHDPVSSDSGIADIVRGLVAERTGLRPEGPVRMLCQLRTMGWSFNPVTLYFCHHASGALAGVVLEVTNTPWGDRHVYVVGADLGEIPGAWVDKAMHVSPFLPMGLRYWIRVGTPGERLRFRMDVHDEGGVIFNADLDLVRRPLTAGVATATVARHPAMALAVSVGIYRQALALWRKRVPLHRPTSRKELP